MNLLQFKDTYHYTEFSSPKQCMDLIKESGLEATTIRLYENQHPNFNRPIYYTLFKTIYTLRKPGKGLLISKEHAIEDSTFEELKERHYKAASKALEDIGRGENIFIAVFGWGEPRLNYGDYPGVSGNIPQRVSFKANSNRRYR